ncbi:hypothetical protein DY000_02050222 [Brassica cretica]|uniref:Uncharacterized protein n=1 Tax=Brassica cretica TaxID=69181 RepID=A0ABQ7EXP1_BRACR|nr:hypothetical protein DY000_02050222 [Brassica cretica]
MFSSQNEKKNSDVEMGEASPVLPIPAIHEATPTFVAGFLSFKYRLSRRSAEKETNRTSAETSVIPSSSTLSVSAEGNKKENGAATETAKKRRCYKGAEGEPLGPLPQYRAKFISLIDGMISDCGSEVERLTEGLTEMLEALKRIEATLKSIEDAHAAETSQLEVQVSGLERDLGKFASALFRMKKEKKVMASEVRRLQRQIQSQE